jgi:DNA repair protein RadA/Sms
MAEKRSRYLCRDCGHQELRWLGRCPECGAWNSFEEEPAGGVDTGGRSARGLRRAEKTVAPRPLDQVEAERLRRLPVQPPDLDRVLGGGLVPGSVVLLGGAPGVGKSTLLTMLAGDFAAGGRRVVYLSAEESAAQVRQRAERLKRLHAGFEILEEPCLERVLPPLYGKPPALLVVDSVQTVYSEQLEGIPGNVSQIRFCGGLLADFARATDCAVALIGHVTKEGDLAGPRVLEHLVDAVLYFEPDAGGQVRMVRAFKNRFGATGELAVLEMTPEGLAPVRDASALFLAGRLANEPGSTVTCVLTGSRPFLVEVQALLSPTAYGTPARVVSGVDSKRVALLAAILERKGGVQIAGLDVFVKVAGGLRISDPAADLALVGAMASSVRERPLPPEQVLLGEVGLTGELRPAQGLALRLQEAAAHGFRKAVVASFDPRSLPRVKGLKVEPVRTLGAALAHSFGLGTVTPLREGG